MTITANEPEFFQCLFSSAQSELIDSGFEVDQAGSLADKIALSFCIDHGGEILRIPMLKGRTARERNLRIVDYYLLMQKRQVARPLRVPMICRKFEICESTARKVVRQGISGGVIKND